MDNHNDWWLRAKFYSLYIDKFAGTISGLTEKLDYFTELGINALHILPHYPSPMCDDGYDIIDHIGVRPELGTIDDFKRLCAEAHKRDIKIMVDLVLNHTSDQHPWFVEARSSKDNPKRDFYLWSDDGSEYEEVEQIFTDFKESNWIPNEQTDDYYYATFKPCQPELNWSNDAVPEEMLKVADELISYGVDGFRLDAIMNLVEEDETPSVGLPATHERIKQLRAHLDAKDKNLVLLGEIVGTTDYAKGYFGNGDECHLSYNFELMNEMWYALLTGTRRDRLKTVLEASRTIPPKASWLSFLRNHDSLNLDVIDESRRKEIISIVDAEKKYSFSKGYETAQRLYSLCDEDETLVREAFSMLYAVPSATVMYYGDEIGMKNAPLPEGSDDMRSVVRAPFDWKEAEKQQADPKSLFHHVRKCIKNS